jgi:hypothetical protein
MTPQEIKQLISSETFQNKLTEEINKQLPNAINNYFERQKTTFSFTPRSLALVRGDPTPGYK